MNYFRKLILLGTCDKIWSLLGNLSATGIKPIPSLVLEMRTKLDEIENVIRNQ
jgi:hypothetical protein